MTTGCELASFLRAAGPVRAPLRPCCLVALIDRGSEREPVPCAARPGEGLPGAGLRDPAEVLR